MSSHQGNEGNRANQSNKGKINKKGTPNPYPEMEFILSEMIKRIIARYYNLKRDQVKKYAVKIFQYLKKSQIYGQRKRFNGSSGWLSNYLRRNPIIEKFLIYSKQERDVEPWMLEKTEMWQFLAQMVTNPNKFDDLPQNTQIEIKWKAERLIRSKLRQEKKKAKREAIKQQRSLMI